MDAIIRTEEVYQEGGKGIERKVIVVVSIRWKLSGVGVGVVVV